MEVHAYLYMQQDRISETARTYLLQCVELDVLGGDVRGGILQLLAQL